MTVASAASTGSSGTGSSGTGSSGTDSSGDTSPIGDIPNLPSFDLPGVTLPTLPNGAFTTPTNPAGLFPTVSPSGRHSKHSSHKATTDSAILPLSSRLIDGQVAGLAVLAVAIAIAVVRLSLRSRPHDSATSESGPNATPAA
jgi:hypothetical protein